MNFSKLLPDIPFQPPVISKAFQELHERNLELLPGWSLIATRRKLAASYWLKILANHFAFLLISGSLIVLLFPNIQSVQQVMLSLIPSAIIVFVVLFLTMY